MACMCGDLYCLSCGPAQGNYRCPVCGKWTGDSGCDDPISCEAEQQKALQAEYEYYQNDKVVEE